MNLLATRIAARPTGRLRAETTLRWFTIVTYRADPRALATAIGDARLVPELIDGDALVSAVHFLDTDFRFPGLPLGRWRFAQTNYRAYIRDRRTGEPGVWFFGTALDSPFVDLPRHLWRMPWHRTAHDLRIAADSWSWHCDDGWGACTADIIPDAGPVERLAGFTDLAEARLVLTHPVRGWYRRRDRLVGSYAIWHPAMEWRLGTALSVDHPVFARAGVAARSLHSVLTTREIPFVIDLPPWIDQPSARPAATPDSQAPSTRGRSP